MLVPLYSHISESGSIHRIYFVVFLKSITNHEEQIKFIKDHYNDLLKKYSHPII